MTTRTKTGGTTRTRTTTLIAAAALGALLAGCAGTGSYVWVDALPGDATGSAVGQDYLINTGDVLNIRVYQQEANSTRARVRTDGRVSVPMVGDVDVRGKRPNDVARELEARLKNFFTQPYVTVTVEDMQPVQIPVMGEVLRPGVYNLDPTQGVTAALALAGGPTEYADRDRIFVVRTSPKRVRVRFTYEALTRGEGRAAMFGLHAGDVVVVE